MRAPSLWFSLNPRAFEPRANDGKVLRFEFVEIVAGDRIETGALLNHVCKAVAVREQHPLFNAIREAMNVESSSQVSDGRLVRNFDW